MNNDLGRTGSLRQYRAESHDDYTIFEYNINDGTLVHNEGGLLERFGIEPPARLDCITGEVGHWPVLPEHFGLMFSYFNTVLANQSESANRCSDLELLLTNAQGDCWVNVSSITMTYENSTIIGLFFTSIDEEKRQLLQLIDQAETDSLTGALNRNAFQQAIDRMTARRENHTIVMFDIDGFKHLNDTFGHIIGDKMLIDIEQKLRKGLRKDDIIGRIGGDEFMVCLRNVSDPVVIERLAKHICSLSRHSMPNGMHLSASLGIAVSPRDGSCFEELYKNADIAMYTAKRRGGDGFVLFQPELAAAGSSDALAHTNSEEGLNAQLVDYSVLIRFDILNSAFNYPDILSELFDAQFKNRHLWDIFESCAISSSETALSIKEIITAMSISQTSEVKFSQVYLKSKDGIMRWYRMGFIRSSCDTSILITLTDINEEIVSNRRLRHLAEYDELTGLLTHNAFNRAVENAIAADEKGIAAGEYAIVYFDILRFKAINDMFGINEGDKLLIYIAETISSATEKGCIACRIGSDRFAVFIKRKDDELTQFINEYLEAVADYELAFEIVTNVGIYIIRETDLSVDAMLDRAIIAQSAIKGSYANKFSYYSEELRNAMLSEQEIVGMMSTALSEEQFDVYFQPQYNHLTGKLVGAEALVRWHHPERGVIMPGTFIPIFEKNGFILHLDLFVFEYVCRFLKRCIDMGLSTVPISVNLARYDIFQHDFIDKMERIRIKYDVPISLLRIEITETAIVGSNQHAYEIIKKLHQYGYIVEMDDFGSGYSSLNVLKDIDMDILKLDMKFISEGMENTRGGIILSSIIRMAKWLNLPVIAEGVENASQADYLRSIGCNYIQGYLYAKPMPEESYLDLLRDSDTSVTESQMELIETLDAGNFWNPESLDTLIFSNYVGAAVIFDYRNDEIEVLRVNRKYLQEIGGSISEKDVMRTDPLMLLDEHNRAIYTDMLSRAIETEDEQECECWSRHINPSMDNICLRFSVRMVGRSRDSFLFYESVRNVTAEKEAIAETIRRENIFRAASEHANIYYWEYDVATRKMLPCFRCMRDLGLPALVTNYPDTAIEMGIFPPEVADEYRDMHRQIEQGAAHLEADMPLTAERVMFRVRYTTEFDENGKPVKAYGSATYIG